MEETCVRFWESDCCQKGGKSSKRMPQAFLEAELEGQMECGRGRNYGIFRSYAIFDKSDITRERFRIYEIFITQNQCLRKCSPTFDLPLVEPRRRNRNQQKNGI